MGTKNVKMVTKSVGYTKFKYIEKKIFMVQPARENFSLTSSLSNCRFGTEVESIIIWPTFHKISSAKLLLIHETWTSPSWNFYISTAIKANYSDWLRHRKLIKTEEVNIQSYCKAKLFTVRWSLHINTLVCVSHAVIFLVGTRSASRKPIAGPRGYN